ncbi:hypothetical protein ACTPEM_25715, partial [Clostridioides difficile]
MKTWDGMDMGSTQDITAYVMVFYDEDTNKYIIYPFLFTPKDTEDMLTGESDDVAKNADAVLDMEVVYSKTEIIEQDAIPAKQVN